MAESIPMIDKYIMCCKVVETIERFYEDPENVKAFKEWKRKKYGKLQEKSSETSEVLV